MELLIIWVALALLVGLFASNTTLGFWSGFLFSLLLSPIVGFIIYLFYPSKEAKNKQLKLMEDQNKILANVAANTNKEKDNIVSQLEKLQSLKDNNTITQEEFLKLKQKIISGQ